MSDDTLRNRLIRLAHDNQDFRKELLPILAGDDEDVEDEDSADEDSVDEESDVDAKKKKASLKLAQNMRLLSPEDRHLAMGLVRLAQTMPEQKDAIMGLVTASLVEAAASNGGWDGAQIAEQKPGPQRSESDESYMKGEFTQKEFRQLREKQQGGNLASPDRFASEADLRVRLIRFAHENPQHRKALLPILEAGCEKLPAGPMRDNCESGGPNGDKKKKDDDGKDDGGKKDDGKMPAELLEKFKKKSK